MNQIMAHILVVDDDKRLRTLLSEYLQSEGFAVTAAKDATEAESLLKTGRYDVMVLDVMMPGKTGMEFAKEIREENTIPILMLTAMGEPHDRIAGLESGADDYLSKPFEPKELSLRIQKLLARSGVNKTKPRRTRFGPHVIDRKTAALYSSDMPVALTSSEYHLLLFLVDHLNQIVPREELSRHLNGISERSVDVQITRLRKKIEEDPSNPRYLESVRGKGYILKE